MRAGWRLLVREGRRDLRGRTDVGYAFEFVEGAA